MQNFVVEERDLTEKLCAAWTDEVENGIKTFILTETVFDHTHPTISGLHKDYEMSDSYRLHAHQMSSSPLKLEPQDEQSFFYQSAIMPESRPVNLEERIQIRIANLLGNFQKKSAELRKKVTSKFNQFANSDSKEHERIAFEQDRKLHNLLERLLGHQVGCSFSRSDPLRTTDPHRLCS